MSAVTTTNAAAKPAARSGGTPFGRILKIVRLHLGNPYTTIVLPWIILGIIFLVNVAIWALVALAVGTSGNDARDVSKGFSYSGSSFYIAGYMVVVAVQAISITFPFALSYGATRRNYWLGTSLTFVLLSAMYAIGFTILGAIEQATNGWGLGGHMFTPVYFGDTWWERLLVLFFGLLFFFFVGSSLAAVWVRWKATGMVVFFAALAALLLAAVAALTLTASWVGFGTALGAAGPLGIASSLLIPAAIGAVVGYFILRRATPRS
ncbi:MAG: ABC transporter permease [Pseudolysinimonas sp.]